MRTARTIGYTGQISLCRGDARKVSEVVFLGFRRREVASPRSVITFRRAPRRGFSFPKDAWPNGEGLSSSLQSCLAASVSSLILWIVRPLYNEL